MSQQTTLALDYIKAITAKGGDGYDALKQFDTPEHREAFETWLEEQPKINGETIYRGFTFERGYWEDGFYRLEDGRATIDNLTSGNNVPAFTTDSVRASIYINEFGNGIGFRDSVRVLFTVKTCGLYCVNVSPYSYYREEKEYRCTRDALFVVEGMVDKGSFIAVTLREAEA